MKNKKGSSGNLGDKLGLVGEKIASEFSSHLFNEFDDDEPFPVRLTLEFRPGCDLSWGCNRLVSIDIEGNHTRIIHHVSEDKLDCCEGWCNE